MSHYGMTFMRQCVRKADGFDPFGLPMLLNRGKVES